MFQRTAHYLGSEPGQFWRRMIVTAVTLMLIASIALPAMDAEEIETYAFERMWWRTDLPVQTVRADRTWVWGPAPITSLILEPYDEGVVSDINGARWVQYFDKTRVEITRTDGDRNNEWYVTNGLLARELITGRMQLGDNNYAQYEPADINVAGDATDRNAPTYRSLSRVVDAAPLEPGSTITQTLRRDGSIGDAPEAAAHGVTALTPVENTERTIASVFWDFMNSEGVIYDGFDYVEGRLFDQPLYATGLPVTEPYWVTASINGEPTQILIQAFQRRVLTYTPENPDGWKVEAANVGRHYYRWRYMDDLGPGLKARGVSETRDLAGNLVLLGEVENKARATYAEVEIKVTLLDDQGEEVASFTSYLDSALIEPGEELPFQVWTEYTGDYDSYEISLRSRPSNRFHRPAVVLDDTSGEWASPKRYEIDGMIRNDADEPMEFVQYVVALYNGDDEVVDYKWGMIDEVVLQPGATAEIDTFFLNPKPFSDVRIFVSN